MFVTLVQLSYDGYDVHSCLLCVAGLLVWFHLLVTFLANTNPSINSQHTQHNQQTRTKKIISKLFEKTSQVNQEKKKMTEKKKTQRTIGWGSAVGAGVGGWCDWWSTGSATVTPSWLNSDHICTTTNNNPNNHNNKHTRSPITRARNRSQKGMQHTHPPQLAQSYHTPTRPRATRPQRNTADNKQ